MKLQFICKRSHELIS